MVMLSVYGNLDVMLNGESSNSIESDLENVINGSIGHKGTEGLPHFRGISSQEKESRDIDDGN